MDTIKPILEQKFWIILVVGLGMTFSGWWMTTGTLKGVITTRKGALDAAEKSIPSGEVPGPDWAAKLTVVNAQQRELVDAGRKVLFERQRQSMKWPAQVAGYMRRVPWKQPIPGDALELYRIGYETEMNRVIAALNPLDLQTGKGLVVVAPTVHQNYKQLVPYFKDIPPDKDQMWDLQEDFWVLEPFHQLISDYNGGPNGARIDAVIHRIDRLELHGGDRAKIGQAAPAAPGATSPGASMSAAYAPAGFGPGGPGGAAVGAFNTAVEFDPVEEFGPSGAVAGAIGMMSSPAMSSPGAPGAAGGKPTPGRRYIDDEKGPYRTRGFYMSVVMDHRRLPDFLIELTTNEKCPWPIEIVRVQMQRLNEDDPETGLPIAASGLGIAAAGPMSTSGFGGPSGFGGTSPEFSSSPSFGGPSYSSESPGLSSGAPAGYSGGVSTELFGAESFGTIAPTAGASPEAQAAVGSYETIIADPNMARVTIAGLFIMINPSEAEKVSEEEWDRLNAPKPVETPTPAEPAAVAADGEAMPADAPDATTPPDPSDAPDPGSTPDPDAPAKPTDPDDAEKPAGTPANPPPTPPPGENSDNS